MFVYLEDDTDVGWPALQSWAADTEVHFFLERIHQSERDLHAIDIHGQVPDSPTLPGRTLCKSEHPEPSDLGPKS